MAKNTVLPNLSLVRRKDLGTMQTPVLFKTLSKIILHDRTACRKKDFLFQCHLEERKVPEPHKNIIPLANRSLIFDQEWQEHIEAFTYRFFTDRSESQCDREGFFAALWIYFFWGFSEKYFTHSVGYPFEDSIFYKDSTPSWGFIKSCKKIMR